MYQKLLQSDACCSSYRRRRSHMDFFETQCRTAHKRPPTLRPSHVTWAVSPPVGSYRLRPPSPFIIITRAKSWNSFTVPRRVEGWVDLDTAGKVHTARAQGCKSQWLCDKHNCPQRDSIPGPRALQSDMLPLDHCDLCWYVVLLFKLWRSGLLACLGRDSSEVKLYDIQKSTSESSGFTASCVC